MKIYTKTGDRGETSLGNGQRVKKSDPRIWLGGEIDELNSILGVASSFVKSKETFKILENIQRDIFIIGTIISGSNSTVLFAEKLCLHRTVENTHAYLSKRVTEFEKTIDFLDKNLIPLRNFILPGGTAGASFLHLARSVCRRAERRLVEAEEKDSGILIYLNRLSDLLFILARNENRLNKTKEIIWKKK